MVSSGQIRARGSMRGIRVYFQKAVRAPHKRSAPKCCQERLDFQRVRWGLGIRAQKNLRGGEDGIRVVAFDAPPLKDHAVVSSRVFPNAPDLWSLPGRGLSRSAGNFRPQPLSEIQNPRLYSSRVRVKGPEIPDQCRWIDLDDSIDQGQSRTVETNLHYLLSGATSTTRSKRETFLIIFRKTVHLILAVAPNRFSGGHATRTPACSFPFSREFLSWRLFSFSIFFGQADMFSR